MEQQGVHIWLVLLIVAVMLTDVLTHTTPPAEEIQEVTHQFLVTTPPVKLRPKGEIQEVTQQLSVTTTSPTLGSDSEIQKVTLQLPLTTPSLNLHSDGAIQEVTQQLPVTTPSPSLGSDGKIQEVTLQLPVVTSPSPNLRSDGAIQEVAQQLPLTTPSPNLHPCLDPEELEYLDELLEDICDHVLHPPTSSPFSILDEVGEDYYRFEEQLVQIDEKVCGGFRSAICKPHSVVCGRCKSDGLCHKYHDCCPGVLHQRREDLSTCRNVFPVPLPGDYYFQRTIGKCPSSISRMGSNREDGSSSAAEDLDVLKCENPNTTEPVQCLFVSSAITGLTYSNKYCAACHNDTQKLQKWKASLSCDGTTPQVISQVSSRDELYRLLLSPEVVRKTRCRLTYLPPDNSEYERTCGPQDSNIISTCNATGKTQNYDRRLERACGMYTSVFDMKYNNMFCFICNQDDPSSIILDWMRSHAMHFPCGDPGRVSFSALMDFDDDDSSRSFSEGNAEHVQSAANCLQNEYYDALSVSGFITVLTAP